MAAAISLSNSSSLRFTTSDQYRSSVSSSTSAPRISQHHVVVVVVAGAFPTTKTKLSFQKQHKHHQICQPFGSSSTTVDPKKRSSSTTRVIHLSPNGIPLNSTSNRKEIRSSEEYDQLASANSLLVNEDDHSQITVVPSAAAAADIDVDQINNNNKKKQQEPSLADRWREIQGQDDWTGLLDPMDKLLKSELIRYGEMAQSCYDAFDYNDYSPNSGHCKYPKPHFFRALGIPHHGYTITRYLYAASKVKLPNFFKRSLFPKTWNKDANWMGYVSVSDDLTTLRLGRRDILVAWRGTVTQLEWFQDLMDILAPVESNKIPCRDRGVKVESGFVSLYTDVDEDSPDCLQSARHQLLTELESLVTKYKHEDLSITFTGHSLGSALAVLSAFDVAETGLNYRPEGYDDVDDDDDDDNNNNTVPITVFSFSGPRVGNTRFKERMDLLGVKVLRVYNVRDLVPWTPGVFINEHVSPVVMRWTEKFPWTYSHVGTELALDHRKSPFLKREDNNKVNAHNLEALLHLIDGYQGTGEKFELSAPRDIALVNKASDFLREDFKIPPYWRQDANKGMVKKNGRWTQLQFDTLDDLDLSSYYPST